MIYIVEMFGGALLPKDSYDRARVFQWLFWEQNSHEPYIAGRRFRKAYKKLKDEEIDAEWLPRGYAALKLMEAALVKTDYLVSNAITHADIAVAAYTRVAHEGGFALVDYPAIGAWIARVENDLSVPASGAA